MTNEVALQCFMLNDVYEYESRNGAGGLAEVAGMINRLKNGPCFLTVSGDFIGGSNWGVFEGKPMVEIFNEMKVDAVAIGNHDFDYGPEVTLQRMDESNFMWLGSNVVDKTSGQLFGKLQDVHMLTVASKDGEDQVDFGFFGLCTETTPVVSRPGDNIDFLSAVDAAKASVKKLQDMGADIIIAVTHLDLNEDINLAKEIPQISVILGGHEHTPYGQLQGDTLIYKCGQNANLLGVCDIRIFIDENDDLTVVPSWNTIANFRQEPDPGVEAIVKKYRAIKDELDADLDMNEVMATVIEYPLSSKTNEIRIGLSKFGSLVADSYADFYQTIPPLGIMNAGGIRGDAIYPVGADITRGIIRDNEVRFEDTLVEIKIKGKRIKDALEQALDLLPVPTGAFPQLSSGFRVVYDVNEKPGYRIHTLEIGGVPYEAEKEYEVAMTTFIYQGGDGITAWGYGEVCEHIEVDMREIFGKYLQKEYPNGVNGVIPLDRINQGSPPAHETTNLPPVEDTEEPTGGDAELARDQPVEESKGDTEGTKLKVAKRPDGKRIKKKCKKKILGNVDIWGGAKGRVRKRAIRKIRGNL